MKRKIYASAARTLVGLIAIVALSTSCDKQENEPIAEEVEGRKMSITAERDGSPSDDTKTSIDGRTFSWVDTDALGVYLKGEASKVTFNYTSGAGTKSAAFTGTLNPNSVYVYATYPEDASFATVASNVVATFTLPTVQVQAHDGENIKPESTGEYAFMYGRSTSVVSTATNFPMSMKHLMTIFDFNLTGIPTGEVVKSLSVTTSSSGFHSSARVNLDDNTITPSGNKKTILVNTQADVTVTSGKFTFRLLMFPETVAENTTWTVVLTTEEGIRSYEHTYDAERVYEAGKRYTVGLEYGQFTGAVVGEEITNLTAYPKVKVGTSHSIYVYDRNAGVKVPKTTGNGAVNPALNWINGTYAEDTDNFAFKGDYYTWDEALLGFNLDGSAMCPKGWRLPTEDEYTEIKGKIGYPANVPTLTVDGKECFFPLSGHFGKPEEAYGRYWSSDSNPDIQNGAYSLEVFSSSSAIGNAPRGYGLSVRCVKTVPLVVAPPSEYPTVKVGASHSIYVYDRNAGISVPKTSVQKIAENWINGGNSPDNGIGDFAFKGDYYTWHEAIRGLNSDENAMCPKDWRLPTHSEYGYISNKITHASSVATLTGDNGKTCFFPLSGDSSSASSVRGYYWSSNEAGTAGTSNANYLFVGPESTTRNSGEKWYGHSVRCVKTVPVP